MNPGVSGARRRDVERPPVCVHIGVLLPCTVGLPAIRALSWCPMHVPCWLNMLAVLWWQPHQHQPSLAQRGQAWDIPRG